VDCRRFETIFCINRSFSCTIQRIGAIARNFVDGKFTLGENIGDLGGVNAAYDGLQLYLKENGNPGLIDTHLSSVSLFLGQRSGVQNA
jgi:predicted metalloendopeptidase